MPSVGRRVRWRDTPRIQSVFCCWCGLCPPLSFQRWHQSGFHPMLHWALVSVLLLLRSQPASQAWHSDHPPSLMPWGSSGVRFLHLGDPPHHLPSVSHLSNPPLGRPLWVPLSLESLSWGHWSTLWVLMCVWLVLAVFFLQSGTSLRTEVMASFAHTPVPVGLGV